MWTQFWDMHSGGGQKDKWANIYIEAPEDEAIVIFYNRFGHNPRRVTCTCCGEDYAIEEYTSLEQATAYQRGCDYKGGEGYIERPDPEGFRGFVPFEKYINVAYGSTDLFDSRTFIYKEDILPSERIGEVPEQGYVWVD